MTFSNTTAKIGRTLADSVPYWPEPVKAPKGSPNVLVVLFDDVGFSDFGCYGSPIKTPTVDALAGEGLRYTGFHTTAMCSTTRAALLTGLWPARNGSEANHSRPRADLKKLPSYLQELGYEVVCAWSDAVTVWDALLSAGQPLGMLPAGLGARDTLRTEMGYALHGHELSAEITPVMAGLGWAVGWDKPTFWGAEALKRQRAAGPSRRSRAIKAVGRGIPRPGMDCVGDDGAVVGTVTSGTFSPTLQTGIGLALLEPGYVPGVDVGVQVRARVEPFTVEKAPLVHPHVKAQ